jgi:hypothetical protein
MRHADKIAVNPASIVLRVKQLAVLKSDHVQQGTASSRPYRQRFASDSSLGRERFLPPKMK